MVWPFHIVTLPPELAGRRSTAEEFMGSKEKFWVINTRTGRRALWKEARPLSGEDWSEKVAHHIAERIGVPSPRVDLASLEGKPGVLCWDFLQPRPRSLFTRHGSLVHGNELLFGLDPTYPQKTKYRVKEHHIAAVFGVLCRYWPSIYLGRFPSFVRQENAFDSFVGYLMLDALIGNTDRHHENWGVVEPGLADSSQLPLPLKDEARLAPSYDHASSLGRELDDVKRRGRMDSSGRGTLEQYAAKARSAFFTEAPSRMMTPLEAFQEAGMWSPAAYSAWRDHLESISVSELTSLVGRVPSSRLSVVGKRFAKALLTHNYHRLME